MCAAVSAAALAQEKAQKYPVFTTDHLDEAMKTIGLAFTLARSAIDKNSAENAKDYLVRARDQLATTITFWRDRKNDDAVATLRETLKKMDALDAAMSTDSSRHEGRRDARGFRQPVVRGLPYEVSRAGSRDQGIPGEGRRPLIMPLYEYSCRACAKVFEALILPGRDTTLSCPSCSSVDVERLISSFAVDSDSTRKSNLEAGRRHLKKEQIDKQVADREEIEHHQH